MHDVFLFLTNNLCPLKKDHKKNLHHELALSTMQIFLFPVSYKGRSQFALIPFIGE